MLWHIGWHLCFTPTSSPLCRTHAPAMVKNPSIVLSSCFQACLVLWAPPHTPDAAAWGRTHICLPGVLPAGELSLLVGPPGAFTCPASISLQCLFSLVCCPGLPEPLVAPPGALLADHRAQVVSSHGISWAFCSHLCRG